MFDFEVFQSGEMFGRPEVHSFLDCGDVYYAVMFGTEGTVWSTVTVALSDEEMRNE